MSDGYQWWRDALAGKFGPVHESEPQPGFYRRKLFSGKTAPWAAVAIFPGANGMVAMQNKVVVPRPTSIDAMEAWMWCADNPIPEETYRLVAEQSQPWPSDTDGFSRKRQKS
jgi:hypothetical protein